MGQKIHYSEFAPMRKVHAMGGFEEGVFFKVTYTRQPDFTFLSEFTATLSSSMSWK